MFNEYINFSIGSFKHRKMRSFLTVIGIFIGIASVVALLSISQGMQDSIEEQFEQFGTDKIIIMSRAGGFNGPPGLNTIAKIISEDDVDEIRKNKGISTVSYMITRNSIVKFKSETKFLQIWALPADKDSREMIMDMQGFGVVDGREIDEDDKYKTVVGSMIRDAIFDKDVDIRNKIEINGKSFEVVGIMAPIGNQADDSSIAIPLDTMRDLFDIDEEVSVIFAQVKEGLDPNEVAEDLEDDLRDFRGEDEDEETFQVMTNEQLQAQVGDIIGLVQAVIIGIAGISLIVGAVGIMNTMYTTVLERTKEIGIMKAIGARNNDVLSIFLIESGLIGLVGGGIGCVLGIIMAIGVEVAIAGSGFIPLKASITPELIGGVLLFSFVVGAVSGVFPAKKASEMNPVDALRHE
jgi:putative ABC transport system permease protein